jgi:hypothetical protein
VRRREHFEDPHALHALPEREAVDRVAIAEKVGWRGVVRERLHDLLGGPGCGGMLGHVDVEDPPPMMGEPDEHEEDAQVPDSGWFDRSTVAPFATLHMPTVSPGREPEVGGPGRITDGGPDTRSAASR